MIAKKNKKANLERKRFAFFQIGLLVSGSLVLAAFEYSTVQAENKVAVFQDPGNGTEILPEIPEDFKEKEPQKPAPKVVNMELVDTFNVVKNLVKTGQVITTNKNIIVIDEGIGDVSISNWGITPENNGKIHEWVETEPTFVGGETAMYNWLQGELNYPELCADMGIQGIAYVTFVINTDGSICQVTDAGSPHTDLSAEAMRAVKKMPKWKPGEQAGKKVRVRYTIPIKFVLH